MGLPSELNVTDAIHSNQVLLLIIQVVIVRKYYFGVSQAVISLPLVNQYMKREIRVIVR